MLNDHLISKLNHSKKFTIITKKKYLLHNTLSICFLSKSKELKNWTKTQTERLKNVIYAKCLLKARWLDSMIKWVFSTKVLRYLLWAMMTLETVWPVSSDCFILTWTNSRLSTLMPFLSLWTIAHSLHKLEFLVLFFSFVSWERQISVFH